MNYGEQKRLISGEFPLFDELSYIDSKTAISDDHFYQFFKMRGWIKNLSDLTLVNQNLQNVKLPLRYEYKATFKDELGTIELSSPVVTDERNIHRGLAKAYNDDMLVDIMVFVQPFPAVDAKGKLATNQQTVITYWPIKIEAKDCFEEEASFTDLGNGWEITFRGTTVKYSNDDGFFYLHELIRREEEFISSLDLTIARKGSPVSAEDTAILKGLFNEDDEKDEEQEKKKGAHPKKHSKQLNELNILIDKERQKLEWFDPYANKKEFEDCEENIKMYQVQFMDLKNFRTVENKLFSDYVQPIRRTLKKSVERALIKIKKEQPVLHEILAPRIETRSFSRYYSPLDHTILWII
jgi:hypothetical protein